MSEGFGIICLSSPPPDEGGISGLNLTMFLSGLGGQLIGFTIYTTLFGNSKNFIFKVTRSNSGKVSLSHPVSFVYIIWSRIGREQCHIASLLVSLSFSCFLTSRLLG